MNFSLTGEDGEEIYEGVNIFNYLERLLDRLDNDCPAVLRNIRKA